MTLKTATVIQNERKRGWSGAGKLPSYRTLFLLAFAATLTAAEPPDDLLQRVAEQGSRFETERGRYTYTQTFHFIELDKLGAQRGDYLEVRDVTFTPDGERDERFLKGPHDRLKFMRLTDEDFRDIRDVQPFVLTADTLWLYETRYQGEERLGERDCFVYRIRPRQVLEGQRLLDGQIWIDQQEQQIVQVSGQPLPQKHSTENANLFPHFLTRYEPVDEGMWFPVKTLADDTLAFPSGLQHVRYEIDFADYKRFTAETEIRFDEPEAP